MKILKELEEVKLVIVEMEVNLGSIITSRLYEFHFCHLK